MNCYCDFHLHSCLSPCGHEDMTPYNIANLAKLLGHHIIALTDHNTTGNCAAAMKAGEAAGIAVIPGMELCTSEEIHVICLFAGLAEAEAFGAFVKASLPPMQNRPEIFGSQILMNHEGLALGQEDSLLIAASKISIEEVRGLVDKYGGVCYPAHISRASFSMIASLGTIPPGLGFPCAEVSLDARIEELREQYPVLNQMLLLAASDAHYLEDMPAPHQCLELPSPSPEAVVGFLRGLPGPFS